VIHGYPDIPQETKDKVMNIIKQHNYIPKNKVLGLFIVDFSNASITKRVIISPYFSSIVASVIDTSRQLGFSVLVTEIIMKEDIAYVEQLIKSKSIAGGVFVGADKEMPFIKKLMESDFKMVIFDQKDDEGIPSPNVLYINPDNHGGAYLAVTHLIELKHKKIAHIGGGSTKLSTVERVNGYKKALKDAGIKYNKDYVIKSDYKEEGGYSAMKKLLTLPEPPTAVFAGNDSMAIGAIKAVYEAGLNVPNDISIVGFDDIEISKYINPPLTTIKASIIDSADMGVRKIVDMIEKKNELSARYIMKTELIIRNSTKEYNTD
jgi:LacI family transcriptional regulator